MQWQGRRESTNIEDRRGMGSGGGGLGGGLGGFPVNFPTGGYGGGIGSSFGGGGLGIGAIIVVLIIGWIAGVNPIDMLTGGSGGVGSDITDQDTGQVGTPSDQQGQFVATVLADTEDTWTKIFAGMGKTYTDPTLVLFTGSTSSACGFASAASGPFYCPDDRKVYLDLAFFDQLQNQFHAPGQFAEAYVIAHEIGHHVQNLLGLMKPGDLGTGATSLSVRTELQADCFAGIWAKNADQEGILDPGDIDAALNAASQIGDDTLEKETQGYVVPDSFTHGTSAQRSSWFKRGYTQGTIPACDTFSATTL